MKCAICGRDHNKIISQNVVVTNLKRDVEVELFYQSSGYLLVCSRCVATHVIPLRNNGKHVVGFLAKSGKLVIYPQAKKCKDTSVDIDSAYKDYKDIFIQDTAKYVEGVKA